MKKTTFLVLCVAILSQLTITSCSDKELTEEERRQQQEQQADDQFLLASDFWHVVGQLSTAEVLPDDWQTKTFEPGIGLPSDKSATTRIVLTNQAEAAAESFENLTGADVTNVNSYTWKRDFGTLTYEQLHDGTGWAVVEVDIKQMPGLKRIVYCTPEQQGLNANVAGTPYYRFGDVVKKKNANREWEYWVCVRPCFGPEYKGDSHWMCLGSLPAANIGSYKYKDNREWFWPKSLASNDEHIKNLSEMTYAIMNPEAWQNYYISNQKQSMFHDFSFKNINYHNQYFWKLVQEAWNEPIAEEGGQTVFQLLFHRTMSEVKADKQLRFFYGSGSGPGTFTWNICLTTALVTYPSFRLLNTQKHKKSGDQYSFDIREYSRTGRADNSTYFNENGNNPYIYPLRYLRGDKLLGSNPNNYQSMNGVNDIYDVYVFNKHYKQNVGSQYDMNTWTDEAAFDEMRGWYSGQSFYRWGDVVKDEEGSLWFCIQPSGGYEDMSKAEAEEMGMFLSNKSFFISLTPGHFKGNSQYRTNLPTWQEAAPIGILLTYLSAHGPNSAAPKNAYTLAFENIKKYAKVDITKLMVKRDTLHNESSPDREPFTNHVPAFFTNLAYSDANHAAQGKQGLERIIYDFAARSIVDGEVKYNNRWSEFLIWNCYEYGNREKMFLQDLTSIDKVNMYAAGDRWVTLPWYTTGHTGPIGQGKDIYTHEKPRETCYNSISCDIFDWDEQKMEFNQPEYVSMYKEPIVFCRLMAVHDTGKQELVSTDGRKFTEVKFVEADNINSTKTRKQGLLDGNVKVALYTAVRKFYYLNGVKCEGALLGEE